MLGPRRRRGGALRALYDAKVTAPNNPGPAEAPSIRQQVENVPWYHVMELPGGVRTPGVFDLYEAPGRLPLPASLEGKRCLDVGCADGFWAFELEKRGAASVVATDVNDTAQHDWPATVRDPEVRAERRGRHAHAFAIAKEALGSSVERIDVSPYDLNPEDHGMFDFVCMGSLLLHLRDPHRALAAVRSVTAGEFFSNDAVSLGMSIAHPRRPAARISTLDDVEWSIPNVAGLKESMKRAGFSIFEMSRPYRLRVGAGHGGRTSHLLQSAGWPLPWPGLAHISIRARPY